MAQVEKTKSGWTTLMRWTARLMALVATGLFVWFVVEFGGEVLTNLSWGPQGIPLLAGILVALVGLLLAWRWEMVGGLMAMGGSVLVMALVCIGSGLDMLFCALLFTLPILVAAGLYLGCCWQTRLTTLHDA
ncbi:MAG: hypothetical protein PVF47_13210 [Anaerolineae bacterium]|jgi:hypothetical protein